MLRLQGGITRMNITIKPKQHSHKMSPDELQAYLKLKRGNGSHKSKRDYNRKAMKKACI
jgi:hypothetical protein